MIGVTFTQFKGVVVEFVVLVSLVLVVEILVMLAALVSVAFLLLSLCLRFCKRLTQMKPSTHRNDQLLLNYINLLYL